VLTTRHTLTVAAVALSPVLGFCLWLLWEVMRQT
jgi:hypothetical protein